MPQVVSEVLVPVSAEVAFIVSQSTGDLRLRWDPFIRKQYFLDGATRPGKGVRTRTLSKVGPAMTSEYVSYNPPGNVGMTMVEGPWFFDQFGGGWRFTPQGDGSRTRAKWKYTYSVKPRFLQPIANPIGQWLLGKEIRKRIDAFAAACADPDIVAAAIDQAQNR